MELTGISANDPAHGQSGGLPTQELDRNAFMQLLVAQLENQDPLSPTANEDFLAQLSSFSSLEQLEQVNDGLMAMLQMNRSNALLGQLTQGSALIGQEVVWTDPETGLEQQGVVDSVKLREGIAFLNVEGLDVPLAAVGEIVGEAGGGGDSGDGDSGDGDSGDGDSDDGDSDS